MTEKWTLQFLSEIRKLFFLCVGTGVFDPYVEVHADILSCCRISFRKRSKMNFRFALYLWSIDSTLSGPLLKMRLGSTHTTRPINRSNIVISDYQDVMKSITTEGRTTTRQQPWQPWSHKNQGYVVLRTINSFCRAKLLVRNFMKALTLIAFYFSITVLSSLRKTAKL